MSRKGTGRLLRSVLSLTLAASMALSGAQAAFAETGAAAGSTAATGSGAAAGSTAATGSGAAASSTAADQNLFGRSSGGAGLFSGNKVTDASGAGEADPLENTVVVLMEDGSLETRKKVSKALSTGDEAVDDISVKNVWKFDDDESGMSLQSTDGQASSESGEQDTVVALVSSDSMSASKLAKKLRKRKDVEYAEKNFRVHALSVSDDTYSDYQWSMQSKENAPNIEYEWNDKGTTGTDKIVAVVDTGVDYLHPDLKDNMWVNTHRQIKGEHGYDFINGDADPMDDQGHGTHCAGIIGAAGNNKEGISGVNQSVRIMALKVLDSDGSAWLSHEIAAYNYINKALDLGEPVVAINNSWGGGEYSEIFTRLVDIVGQKGAATICAAGNEASNNDEDAVYPATVDSPYLIDVAATGRNGELADYSNYGESVDVAAPGSEILSTVCYYTYNPTVYGERQAEISKEFSGFDDEENGFAIPEKVYVNGKECEKDGNTFRGKDGQEISWKIADEGFSDDDKHALEITYKEIKSDDMVSFEIPYEVEDAKIKPHISAMVKTEAPENTVNGFTASMFLIGDLEEDAKTDLTTISESFLNGVMLQGKPDRWNHLELGENEESKAGEKRKFAVSLYAAVGGDYKITLDDMGISRQDIDKEALGKYDYMSGTSMAAPFITGTVALKAAEKEKSLGEGETLNIADVLNEISAMAKEEPELNVCPRGSFDFRKAQAVLPPRVGKLTVDTDRDEIRISGSGLFPDQPGFKVEVGEDFDNMTEAEVIPEESGEDGRDIVIKNSGWINNIECVRVTGANGKVSRKKDLYLVNGKKEYTVKDGLELEVNTKAVCTDGKYIYSCWPMTREIKVQDPSKKDDFANTLVTVKPARLFDVKKDDNIKYGMLFDGITYANGKLYSVVEYGEADEIEQSDDMTTSLGAGKKKTADDEDAENNEDSEDGVYEFENSFSIYAGEYKLVSVSTKADVDDEDAVKDLGKLPEELEDLNDYTMTSYFGKIYFIGGSRGYRDSITLSDKVFVFDPATGEWSDGPALPEARAGGQALQYGSELFYTLGESPETIKRPDDQDKNIVLPDNLVFDGVSWRACSVQNELVKMYSVDDFNVGLTAKGLIYSGAPAKDLGDTFIYDVAQNRYVDTGYNFLKDPEQFGPKAYAVGGTLYSAADEGAYTIPIESGLVSVKAKKSGKGKVTGTGSYLPGSDAKITIKASKKYYIKSLKVNGKKVKLSKKQTKKVYTIKKMTSSQSIKVVFAKKKK